MLNSNTRISLLKQIMVLSQIEYNGLDPIHLYLHVAGRKYAMHFQNRHTVCHTLFVTGRLYVERLTTTFYLVQIMFVALIQHRSAGSRLQLYRCHHMSCSPIILYTL
jgi:hypothetical protein